MRCVHVTTFDHRSSHQDPLPTDSAGHRGFGKPDRHGNGGGGDGGVGQHAPGQRAAAGGVPDGRLLPELRAAPGGEAGRGAAAGGAGLADRGRVGDGGAGRAATLRGAQGGARPSGAGGAVPGGQAGEQRQQQG